MDEYLNDGLGYFILCGAIIIITNQTDFILILLSRIRLIRGKINMVFLIGQRKDPNVTTLYSLFLTRTRSQMNIKHY